MTWPSSNVNNTNVDASGDDPDLARVDLKDLIDKFNQLRTHVSTFIQGLLDDTDAATARATLGLSTVYFFGTPSPPGMFTTSTSGTVTVTSLTGIVNNTGAFNATTGVFTAPVNGIYEFSLAFHVASAAGAPVSFWARVNGAGTYGTQYSTPTGTGGSNGAGNTFLLALTAGHTVDFQTFAGSAISRTLANLSGRLIVQT